MQYQEILLLLNIIILIMVYFFCREKPKQLRILFATTIYAYILAAPLPRLLVWIPLKWIVLFYVIEIGLAFIVMYLILYNYPDIKIADERKKAEQDIQNLEKNESNTEKITGILLSDTRADSKGNVVIDINGVHKPKALEDKVNMNMVVPVDPKEPAALDKPDIDLNESKEPEIEANIQTYEDQLVETGEHNIEESNSYEELDIEELINQAFDAKCKDDYRLAIQIFEQILKQELPEEMVALIADDIEIMRKKLS